MAGRIGLVILDYDQAPTTRRCLQSIAGATRRPEEIVLVENGPPVDLADEGLDSLNVRLVRPGRNVGAAAGRNLGFDFLVRNSTVERFMVLDNDTIVPPDYFELAANIALDPLEVAAPLVFDLETDVVIYAGGTCDGTDIPRVIDEWPEGNAERRAVDWAPTAALMFNRDIWTRIGGFDPWYEFLWEDLEWCRRAIAVGGQVRVVPQLRVMHMPHQSSGGFFSPGRNRLWARNGTVFLFDRGNAGWSVRARWVLRELRTAAREHRTGLQSTAKARLRGLGEGLREAGRRWWGRTAS